MSHLSRALNKRPDLKLVFASLTAYLKDLAKSLAIGEIERISLYDQHLKPIKEMLDSDGDGVADDLDADPKNPDAQ